MGPLRRLSAVPTQHPETTRQPDSTKRPHHAGGGRADSEQEHRRMVGRRAFLQRQWLDVRQHHVADAAGLTRNYVSAIERGTQRLDAWRLGLLADALGVTAEWLLDRTTGPVTVPGPTPTPSARKDPPQRT